MNNSNYDEIKASLSKFIDNNYKDFVKALISIEENINNEDHLNKAYEKFISNDDMHLLNSEFEDILYDISVEDNYRYTKFDNIEIIDKEKASKILNSSPLSSHAEYEPLGSFYYKDDDLYVAIDNTGGNAFVEEFDNLDDCIDWLNHKFEMSDYLEQKNTKTSIQDKFSQAVKEAEKRNSDVKPDMSKPKEHQL